MEILQIYLTNANFTPENGRVQQWAGQLLMVFKIPRTLHDTQMEILIRHTGVRKAGSYSAYSSSSESDLQSVSSALPQDVPSLPPTPIMPMPLASSNYGTELNCCLQIPVEKTAIADRDIYLTWTVESVRTTLKSAITMAKLMPLGRVPRNHTISTCSLPRSLQSMQMRKV
jgi:hypothetical protein